MKAVYLPILVLLQVGVSRLLLVAPRSVLLHDEAITRLVATCHQLAYAEVVAGKFPSGVWSTAADWQALLRFDQLGCWGEISHGLAVTDIHPPLYFWLIHAWWSLFEPLGGLGFGTGGAFASGPLLNALLAILGVFAVADLGRQAGLERQQAWAASALWGLSAGALSVSVIARQYELYALITVLTISCFLRAYRSANKRGGAWMLALSGLSGMGLLTHYQFALVLFAMCSTALLLPRAQRLSFAISMFIAAGMATGLLVMLHPELWDSFARQGAQAQSMTAMGIPSRILGTARGWMGFVVWEHSVTTLLMTLLLLFAAWRQRSSLAALFAADHKSRNAVAYLRRWIHGDRPAPERVVPFILAILAALFASTYILHVVHAYAVGGRYYAPLWPLLALTLVAHTHRWEWRWRNWHKKLPLVIAAAALFASAVQQYRLAPPLDLASKTTIIVDSLRRGVLPRALIHLAPDTRVLAADPEYLKAVLLDELPSQNEPLLYVSSLDYGNTLEDRDTILTLLERHMNSAPEVIGRVANGTVFLFSVNHPSNHSTQPEETQ